MGSDTDPRVLRVRTEADLVTVLPYLLGFHPEHSLVVVCQTEQREPYRLCLMRFDLPDPASTGELLDEVAATVSRVETHTAWIVVYAEDAALPGDGGPLVAGLAARLGARGISTGAAIRVHDRRWWDYSPRDDHAAQGRVPPPDRPGGASLIAAEAVALGLVARASRAELAATLAPADPRVLADVEAEVAAIVAGLDQREAEGVDGWAMLREQATRTLHELLAADPGGGLEAPRAALLLVALYDPALLDECLSWACDQRGETAGAVWTQLLRMAPPPLGARPATLLAYQQWQHGGGALVGVALDEALRHDPQLRLARMLREAVRCGVNPAELAPDRWTDQPPTDHT
ncbi:MAG: DUF4192 domain-containing protein [Sporichthyaceae bacterium]|nr:DUF4192 domain-containing protein [Sporichthyaceae bacterium]